MKLPKILSLLMLGAGISLAACSTGNTDSHDHDQDTEEGHHHESGESSHLELSQQQMEAVGIRLGSLEARNMTTTINATGRLEVSSLEEALVTPRLGGTITRLLVTTGQTVKSGETVAYVECPEILNFRQEYLTAVQETGVAQKEVDRQQALASQGAGVRKNLDNAIAALKAAQLRVQGCISKMAGYGLSAESVAKEGLATIPVKAEMSGTVTEVMGALGSYTDPQIPIARIVNTSGIYCTLQLLEKDLTSVKPGQTVSMILTNNPAVQLEGRVAGITPAFDSETHTAPVKVTLTHRPTDQRLIPGMAVTAQINLAGALSEVLPEEAVVSSGGKSYIFVLEDIEMEDGVQMYHFEKVEVAAGPTMMGYTEITPIGELPAEPKIVVGGAFYLNSMSSDHGEHSH